MAVLPKLKEMQGVFSLGHWGDVFFDRGAPEGTQESDIIPLLTKRMIKKGGLELAQKLWKAWDLEGDFKNYFISRIETLLSKIKIDNISAKVRAFKTTQWAHRWTTTNLNIFEAAHPITLPYYDARMCEFVCNTPEDYLADRRMQIAHLKQHAKLSKITWHAEKPFNLNNYQYNRFPYNVPYRALTGIQRKLKSLQGSPYIQRNWELQFLGTENDTQLKTFLFSNNLESLVPKEITKYIYQKFNSKDAVFYSHPLSMLLTLSVWNKKYNNSSKIEE